MADVKIVSKFEPKAIKDILEGSNSDWQEGEAGRTDYFLFLYHAALTVSILRRKASRLISEVIDGRIQDTLASLRKLGETILIIEGSFTLSNGDKLMADDRPMNVHFASLQGFLLSIQRQGVMVFYTSTLQESAAAIQTFANHYGKEKHFVLKEKPSQLFEVTPQVELLTALPGVSIEIAMRLLATYDCPIAAMNMIIEGEEVPFLSRSQLSKIQQILVTHD